MNELEKELNTLNQEQQSNNLAIAQKQLTALVDKTYAAKLESEKAEKNFKSLKAELVSLMESAEVDKMIGKDCSVSLTVKNSVTVPKDLPSKIALFSYIDKEYGREVLDEMLTINARSFSSWYDKEVDKHIQEGEIDFKLPMLSPYERTSLGIRKIAKKNK